jgi:hypothetical protein
MAQIASDFKETFGSCFGDCDIGRAWQLVRKINFFGVLFVIPLRLQLN